MSSYDIISTGLSLSAITASLGNVSNTDKEKIGLIFEECNTEKATEGETEVLTGSERTKFLAMVQSALPDLYQKVVDRFFIQEVEEQISRDMALENEEAALIPDNNIEKLEKTIETVDKRLNMIETERKSRIDRLKSQIEYTKRELNKLPFGDMQRAYLKAELKYLEYQLRELDKNAAEPE